MNCDSLISAFLNTHTLRASSIPIGTICNTDEEKFKPGQDTTVVQHQKVYGAQRSSMIQKITDTCKLHKNIAFTHNAAWKE